MSADEGGACTPAALAGLLDLPRVLGVSAVERDGAALLVQRELEGGAIERLRIRPPAVLAVQSSARPPRRANLRAIKAAREEPVERLAPSELGVDAAELEAIRGSRVRALCKPERRGAARMLEGSPAQIAQRISEILAAERSA
jgi:electron transfer flavoprotein beta subunit